MTSIIYQRGQSRESTIWDTFLWNGPFNAVHDTERATLFGIYAYSYLQGHAYLQEIETDDLARLVDTYNANIAGITNDEAKLVLDVAAKRYLERIESILHLEKKVARGREIDALDQEYDAKIEALEADQLAITTKTAEVLYARDRTGLKITELEINAELEEIKQSLIDAEITEKEIEAARIDLRILQSGVEGLNIQLAITQAALDLTNTRLQITNAENEESEMDIRISEVDLQVTEEGIREDNVGLQEVRSSAEEQRLIARAAEMGVRVAEADLDVEEAEVKQVELYAQRKNIEADTTKLGLIDTDLALIVAQRSIQAADNQTQLDQVDLIESKGENVTAETGFYEDYQTTQEELDEKLDEHETTKGDAERDRLEDKISHMEKLNTLERTQELPRKKDLADDKHDSATEEADDRAEIHDLRADKAEEKKDAAVRAASDLAEADIINTLTHSIGSA